LPAEANYLIHDKELLTIIRYLEAWAPELYIVNVRTQVRTHHAMQPKRIV
jgi:hypothetical protein